MSKATPRPWNIDGGITIRADKIPIAHTYSDYLQNHEESKANAELIVRAVNFHDELISAIENTALPLCDMAKFGAPSSRKYLEDLLKRAKGVES